MKLTLKPSKPRNPYVVAGLRRRAGSHNPQGGARRQQAQSAMRREVAASIHADRHKPSP
jgi:hypothetical protein